MKWMDIRKEKKKHIISIIWHVHHLVATVRNVNTMCSHSLVETGTKSEFRSSTSFVREKERKKMWKRKQFAKTSYFQAIQSKKETLNFSVGI